MPPSPWLSARTMSSAYLMEMTTISDQKIKADLCNLRLHPGAYHCIEIEQPEGRTDKRGQFVLPVTPPEQNADALFERAQAAEEIGDRAEVERLYRGPMKSDPTDAAPPFNLGNVLRADGRKVEADSAFRAATRADPMLRRLGTIFPTCWMSRVGPKLRSIVCAGRCTPRRNMSTRCSTLRFYYSEPIGTTKRRSIGGAIWPTTLNLNGQHERGVR